MGDSPLSTGCLVCELGVAARGVARSWDPRDREIGVTWWVLEDPRAGVLDSMGFRVIQVTWDSIGVHLGLGLLAELGQHPAPR